MWLYISCNWKQNMTRDEILSCVFQDLLTISGGVASCPVIWWWPLLSSLSLYRGGGGYEALGGLVHCQPGVFISYLLSQQLTGQTVITTLAGPGLAIMMNSNKLNAFLANILMMNNQFIVKLDVKEEWSNSQGWWHANYVIIMGSPVYCSHNHLYWLQVNVWVKNKSRQQ